MKLSQIALALGCESDGDPDLEITGIATIETAQTGDLTFLSNARYKRALATTRASAVILRDLSDRPPQLAAVVSPNPYLTFAHALPLFHHPVAHPPGIHPLAVIAPTATIGRNVSIGPLTVIADHVSIADNVTILSHTAVYPEVEIGEGSFIHSHCIIRERCRLGRRVTLQNGAIIGSDGFGYAKDSRGAWQKIPQTGNTIIEDDVEIGAGTTIDRATLGSTVIGRGTKIDNLVQVGHSTSVGEDTLLCAQVGLAGSTRVGNQVILGGQVGAAGHLKIGDRVVATAQSGIPNSIPDDRVVSGYPAIENRLWLKSSSIFAQLPGLQRQLRRAERRIDVLEKSAGIDSNSTQNE